MYTILIVIIYLTFISLGLPDTLLGSAWSAMYEGMEVPMSYMGIITMIIAVGTVISSLSAGVLIKRIGTGGVVSISVLLTAVAMLGFAFTDRFWGLCLWAIPYGLGAGAIDAALNNYVALHYSSRHMSWLHCFWGVGTIISPFIMSFCLTEFADWHRGYLIVSIIQFVIVIILFCSIRLWKGTADKGAGKGKKSNGSTDGAAGADGIKEETAENTAVTDKKAADGEIPTAGKSAAENPTGEKFSLVKALKSRGAVAAALAFVVYSAVESTTGYWASSYFVSYRSIDPEVAAGFASLFYIGIIAGRFISGFIANKIGDRNFIRIGICIVVVGIILLLIPVESVYLPCAGLVVIGLGCAPIYPCLIHATPDNFGETHSQSMISIQVASAYVGTTFMPLIFGFIANAVSIGLYPLYLLLFALLILLCTELVNRARRQREKALPPDTLQG